MIEFQTFKGIVKKHFNLQAKWQNKKFKALVDSKAIKNHMSPAGIKKIKLPYRQKQNLYLLVMISEDPISYKDDMIYFETKLVQLQIKKMRGSCIV